MEVKGKVHLIGVKQQISETFAKRSMVLEYAENPTYPEYLQFETLQDKTALLDAIAEGDEVEVSFNLRGRPHTNKEGVTSFYNSLVIWRLTKLSAGSTAQKPPVDINTPAEEQDDMPFN